MRIGITLSLAGGGRALNPDELIHQIETSTVLGSVPKWSSRRARIDAPDGSDMNASVIGSSDDQRRTFKRLRARGSHDRSTAV
jgi:hypothetical protein